MASCVWCNDPLMVRVDEDEFDDPSLPSGSNASGQPQYVPDDLQLACNCHYHWQCFMDNNQDVHCPRCGKAISTSESNVMRVLVNIKNEGGFQEGENIYPLIREENYLRTHPQERVCHAFIEICREQPGDWNDIANLLIRSERRRLRAEASAGGEMPDAAELDDDEDEEDDELVDGNGQSLPVPSMAEIVRYQDPLADKETGLHAAIANDNHEVAWLLLFLGTEMDESEFPPVVLEEAHRLGLRRDRMQKSVDVRSLRDGQGRVPLQVALESGDAWHSWVGRLTPVAGQ